MANTENMNWLQMNQVMMMKYCRKCKKICPPTREFIDMYRKNINDKVIMSHYQ